MARTVNQQSLIDQLEMAESINNRFEDIKCVNSPESGEKRGCFSLVFSANDLVEDKKVAIKAMDPECYTDTYRMIAFDREPEILRKLKNKRRCLKLISGPDNFDWQITTPSGDSSSLPVKYYVSDWLDIDVDTYFLEQQRHEALLKLRIFRSAVLAVDAFHSENISHRDIKHDNLRAYQDGEELVIVVIDFGTAAHFDDSLATSSSDYPNRTVGAPAFSGPEAFLGLASCREIGKLTDIYALGALLYQLFNHELFARARENNKDFSPVMTYLDMKLALLNTHEDKIKGWAKEAPPFKDMLEPPKFDSPSNNAPRSVVSILSKICREMTLFNFQDRTQKLLPIVTAVPLTSK